MERSWLKKNALLMVLLTVLGLSVLAFLSQLDPLASLSQAIQEFAMTAEPRKTPTISFIHEPANPAHEIALFALG